MAKASITATIDGVQLKVLSLDPDAHYVIQKREGIEKESILDAFPENVRDRITVIDESLEVRREELEVVSAEVIEPQMVRVHPETVEHFARILQGLPRPEPEPPEQEEVRADPRPQSPEKPRPILSKPPR